MRTNQEARVVADGQPATVVIAGNKFEYPNGLGATARVAAFAHGLTANGARVKVVSLLTPDVSGDTGGNVLASGVADGVAYAYACGTRVRGATFWRRRLLDARVPFGLWHAVSDFMGTGEGLKAIMAYTDSPCWIIAMAILARQLGAKCLVEVCEIPFVSERVPARLAIKRWLQDTVAYRLVDGFVVISGFLDDYVAEHTHDRAPRIRVPILFDLSVGGDASEARPPSLHRSVAYVGDMTQSGEMPDLLTAFAAVAREYSDTSLKLIGYAPADYRAELLAMANRLGLTGRVEFAGSVPRQQLPAMLADATMLVLPRRDGLFSRAGFPTKLATYLASGRPVVVTSTGEIPRYLRHRVSAYLAPPGDVMAFADQMRHVLDNPAEAREVGLAGREVARLQFDCRRHMFRLIDFLRGL